MPWKQVWEPNPSDDNIPLLKELPPEFKQGDFSWGGVKTASIPVDVLIREHQEGKKIPKITSYYYCDDCKGWIAGYPYEYREDDIGPLCGRRGTVFSCIRCGNEIGFNGMVS